MRGALRPLLASGKPILCLSLNPPLFSAAGESLSACQKCSTAPCPCSAKAALSEALEAALKTELFGAVKLDTAYYEQFGPSGLKLLAYIADQVPSHVAVIIDGRRGDISNTAAAYARAFFDYYRADAVTVSCYMGRDAICPFLKHSNSAYVFVDCRPAEAKGLASLKGFAPSNPTSPLALYEHVASLCQQVSTAEAGGGVLSLIAGVRDVAEAKALWQLRKSFPATPLLLDLHCDVSAFFSQLAKLGEPCAGGSSLVICVSPPTLQDIPLYIQKMRQELHAAYPDMCAA